MSTTEARNAARTFNARMAAKLAQRRSVGHGQGLIGQQMRQPQRKADYAPRLKATEDDKALRALEMGQRRWEARKAEQQREWAQAGLNREFSALDGYNDDAPLFDQCMSGHNTLPEQMAWPESFDPFMVNWSEWDKRTKYDRSLRLYVNSH